MPVILEIPEDLPDEVTNKGFRSYWYRNQNNWSYKRYSYLLGIFAITFI